MRKIMNQKHFQKISGFFVKKKIVEKIRFFLCTKEISWTNMHVYTVWKLQDFSVTQMLRDIKVLIKTCQ